HRHRPQCQARADRGGRPRDRDGGGEASVRRRHQGAAGHRVLTPWLTIVGIGEDGELGTAARAALERAALIVGGARHLALVPDGPAERRAWPSPMLPLVDELVAGRRDRRVVVLASGDPMLHGVGATIAARLDAAEYRVIPHVSAVSLACAR